MILRNSTDWPDYFVRRAVSWCCKELGISPKAVTRFKLRNRADGFTSGHCYSGCGRICVSLGVVNLASGVVLTKGDEYRRRTVDELMRVTAHEVAHRMSSLEGVQSRISRRYHGRVFSTGGSEAQTRWHEEKLMEVWMAQKERLFPAWLTAPQRTTVAAASLADRRSTKAIADLAKWQRKLKLAQTKVRKCKARVNYYERKRAATATP